MSMGSNSSTVSCGCYRGDVSTPVWAKYDENISSHASRALGRTLPEVLP